MPLKNLKDFTDLLVPLQDAYGQLETEYELQRERNHEMHKENARLRELLSDVWTDSAIEHDDKRLDYVVVQMTRSVYEDVRREFRNSNPPYGD